MLTLLTPGQAPSPAILTSVLWVRDALLGTIATSVAVICVAGVGYQVMTGRIPMRRLVTVVIGCFILFGASNIAAALSALARQEPAFEPVDRPPPGPEFTVKPRTALKTGPDPFDPYAGASVPPSQ